MRAVWQRVPPEQIALIAAAPQLLAYLDRLLFHLRVELDSSRHVHAVLMWVHQLLLSHTPCMMDQPTRYEVALRALHKGVRVRYEDLAKLCNDNLFSLSFLADQLLLIASGGSVLHT